MYVDAVHDVSSVIGATAFVEVHSGGVSKHLCSSILLRIVYLSPVELMAMCSVSMCGVNVLFAMNFGMGVMVNRVNFLLLSMMGVLSMN